MQKYCHRLTVPAAWETFLITKVSSHLNRCRSVRFYLLQTSGAKWTSCKRRWCLLKYWFWFELYILWWKFFMETRSAYYLLKPVSGYYLLLAWYSLQCVLYFNVPNFLLSYLMSKLRPQLSQKFKTSVS